MKDNRVLLGFSGGIDSFAAVGLLQAAGYHVTALTLDMRGDSALLEKARLRARTLGIPWRMRSVRERFEREVVDYFTDSYFRGRTPAPCTRCNSRIKWPCLAAEADALGIRYIATGHYFRITSAGGKRYVTRAADNRKDQSYYLWDLPQEILDRVLTPMGTVIKRNITEELADRRESMGVCFLEGRPCRDFLRSRDKTEALRPGPIIDAAGHRLGTHDGAALYTIGQKKGLGLPPGWAAVAIDTAANRIVAGEEKLLLHRTLEVGECRLRGIRCPRYPCGDPGHRPQPRGIRSGLPCRFGDSDRTGESRVGPGRRAARRFVPRGTGRRRRNPRTVLLTNY
uniref:tRNA methyl transferase PRC-barrel domain-containing protein n=1 Tax=Alistipes putredinis TaxID=28117 RepID=UPI003FD7ED59